MNAPVALAHLGASAGGVVGGILDGAPMALPMNGRDEVMFLNEKFASVPNSGAVFSTSGKSAAAAPHAATRTPTQR